MMACGLMVECSDISIGLFGLYNHIKVIWYYVCRRVCMDLVVIKGDQTLLSKKNQIAFSLIALGFQDPCLVSIQTST